MLTVADVAWVTGEVALAWIACVSLVVCVALWYREDV